MNKAELGRLAEEVRRDLGLTPMQRFDPWLWSENWGVTILSLNDVTNDPAVLRRLTLEAPELWSAAVIKDDLGHLVIYNHAHSAPRVMSDLAHEIAHLVAEHRLDVAWMEPNGKKCGAAPDHEREAAELSAALLVPNSEAKAHAIRDGEPQALVERYGVSYKMATWRMDVSGGRRIRDRLLAKQERGAASR